MSPFASAAEPLLGIFLALIIINYVGLIPLYKCLLPRSQMWRSDPLVPLPKVTILIPAYNEEVVISQRIENLIALDYPKEKLQIVVVSDVSTDRTDEIVRSFADRGVILKVMPKRSGKLGILDACVPDLAGEIVVITDATIKFETDALRHLVHPFADGRVGAVGGDLRAVVPAGGIGLSSELLYRRWETALKRCLGARGKLMGGYGGFYAFRKRAFRPIGKQPAHDDVIIPLEVSAQGYWVVFQPKAVAHEEFNPSIAGEYRRRVRMAAFNITTLPRMLRTAAKAGTGMLFIALTYKGLRWISPFVWGAVFILIAILAIESIFYRMILIAVVSIMAAGFMGGLLSRFNLRIKLLMAIWDFLVMNCAAYVGLAKSLKGVQHYWSPVRGV